MNMRTMAKMKPITATHAPKTLRWPHLLGLDLGLDLGVSAEERAPSHARPLGLVLGVGVRGRGLGLRLGLATPPGGELR